MIENLPDYHIHTKLCNHANGEMEEYVEHAISVGLNEMGFSDHMPVMPEPNLCMTYKELPQYVQRVYELQKKYEGQIIIKLGCEMDIVHNRMDEIKEILETYQFDYVIGSIHYLSDWPFDQDLYKDVFDKNGVDAAYDLFFNAVYDSISTGVYDIIGHIDNIKRMGHKSSTDLTPQYERIASLIESMNMAFELNTSGLDKACEEAYPAPEFMKILNAHGIPVTLGSDSHNPTEVGRHFPEAISLLNDAGFKELAYFTQRQRIMKSLPPYSETGKS